MKLLRSTLINNAPADSQLHAHSDWEISATLQGTSISEIEGKDYTIGKGDVVVIPPGVYHIRKSTEDFSYVNVGVENVENLHLCILRDADTNISSLFKMIAAEYVKQQAGYNLICNRLFECALEYNAAPKLLPQFLFYL